MCVFARVVVCAYMCVYLGVGASHNQNRGDRHGRVILQTAQAVEGKYIDLQSPAATYLLKPSNIHHSLDFALLLWLDRLTQQDACLALKGLRLHTQTYTHANTCEHTHVN